PLHREDELRKLIEQYRGLGFRNDDGTWTQLSLKTAEDWAKLDASRLHALAEVREHVSDAFRSYVRAIAAEKEHQDALCIRLAHAEGVLDGWGAILPSRIVNEDLGGFVEDVRRRAVNGQGCLVWLRVVAAIFWTGVNTFGYLIKTLGKKQAG